MSDDDDAWGFLEDYTGTGPKPALRLNCPIHFNSGSSRFPPLGLEVLRGALMHVNHLKEKEQKEVKLLIAAHTDTVDTHRANQTLSDQRARSTLYILQGSSGMHPWAKLCDEESGGNKAKDVEMILKWAAKARDWSCYVIAGGAYSEAASVKAFRTHYAKEILEQKKPPEQSSAVDVEFWQLVFKLYARILASFLPKSISEMRKQIHLVDSDYPAIGCSERGDPTVKSADGQNDIKKRRVDFLLFRPDLAPSRDDELPEDRRPTAELKGDPVEYPDQASLPPQYLEIVYDSRRYTFHDLPCLPYWMGRPVYPGNVLFIIDASGSMKSTKWAPLKQALVHFINILVPESYRFGILGFSSPGKKAEADGFMSQDVYFLWKNQAGGPQLRTATKENKKKAIDWINDHDKIRASGGTQVFSAFAAAMKTTGLRTINPKEHERNTIEFLSDGQPSPRFYKCLNMVGQDMCAHTIDRAKGDALPEKCPSICKKDFLYYVKFTEANATQKAAMKERPKLENKALLEEAAALCKKVTPHWRLNATAFAKKGEAPAFIKAVPKASEPDGDYSEYEL